jgi:glycosyltransferase involved in cell wall biosynthesis
MLPKLAFVGRFSVEKGIGDFLEVCDRLAHRLPLRVALVGGERTDESVRDWAEERPWAFLHGIVPRPRVRSLLVAADVLVCPSRTTSFAKEQFGKAAAEAMAAGTPVFSYDCGALTEVIGAGGVVVPEGAQDQLVDALEPHSRSSAADRVAVGQEARTQAARFTDDAIAANLVGLWSTCSGTAT